jgi:two-component system, LytTR family, response regulator
MKMTIPIIGELAGRGKSVSPPSVRTLWIGGLSLLWVIYATIFVAVTAEPPLMALRGALANVIPLSFLTAGAHALLRDRVMLLSVPAQTIAHVALAIAFAVTWYALIVLLQAFFTGLASGDFTMYGFNRVVFAWQAFQGLIFYALVAASCYAMRDGRQAAGVTTISTPPLQRYLIRVGDDILPVQVDDIVTVAGAQDYSEVVTISGSRHLVRMSLAEFELRLAPDRFIRIHRSIIVNLDQMVRAELAGGGRMLAHMSNGDSVQTSRPGAQRLRQLMV